LQRGTVIRNVRQRQVFERPSIADIAADPRPAEKFFAFLAASWNKANELLGLNGPALGLMWPHDIRIIAAARTDRS
jgi:hypothetical protein